MNQPPPSLEQQVQTLRDRLAWLRAECDRIAGYRQEIVRIGATLKFLDDVHQPSRVTP